MPSAKGVTEVLIKLADGSFVSVTADTSVALQAVFFDPAVAIAAGIPKAAAAPAGITVTRKKGVQLGADSTTVSAMDTMTDTTICYVVDGKLVCYPA